MGILILLQVRMGTFGNRLHARYVRSSRSSPGHLQRREPHVRLLLPSDGANGRKFPKRQRDGLPFRQHEVSHSNFRLGNVRTDALSRRLHPFLLLLPLVPSRLQARTCLSRRLRDLGGHLGRSARFFDSFRSFPGAGALGNL